MTRKEFQRQRRVLDQSLTSHAYLAQTWRRRQEAVTLAILGLSVLATALAFAGEEHRLDLGIAEATLPTWAGVLSTLVFVLALIDLQVRWQAQSGRHEDAARRLGVLKGQFRSATVDGDTVDTGGLDLEAEYWEVMTTIEPIPDSHFVTLKARHRRKVAQSQMLDGAGGAPVLLVRLKVRWQGVRALWSGGHREKTKTAPFLSDEAGSPDGREPHEPPPEARGRDRPK